MSDKLSKIPILTSFQSESSVFIGTSISQNMKNMYEPAGQKQLPTGKKRVIVKRSAWLQNELGRKQCWEKISAEKKLVLKRS